MHLFLRKDKKKIKKITRKIKKSSKK